MSNEIVPRKELNKQLMKGVGGVAGGLGLLILSSVGLVPAIILGGVTIVAGAALSTSKKDRLGGILAIAAGGLGILAKTALGGLSAVSGWLLGLGAAGLIIGGGISLYKFIKNLKKRS